MTGKARLSSPILAWQEVKPAAEVNWAREVWSLRPLALSPEQASLGSAPQTLLS